MTAVCTILLNLGQLADLRRAVSKWELLGRTSIHANVQGHACCFGLARLLGLFMSCLGHAAMQ